MTAHVKPHSPETLAAYWGCSAEKVRTMCRDGELASMYMCTSPPLPPPGRAVMGGLRLLDLFCCAGGAAMGYHRAGFEVVGVDIKPQRKYPFEFIQADCLSLDREFVRSFDAIHASPPCQAHSQISNVSGNQHNHVDRIPETRAMLVESGKPWVMENVPGAPLIDPIVLCGTMFGLGTSDGAELRRHRHFETNWWFGHVPSCNHSKPTITVTGQVAQQNVVKNKVRRTFPASEARRAMGIDWMAMPELSQAIPPAYTEFIGRQLMAHISQRAAA